MEPTIASEIKVKSSPKDVFLHLLSIITLYVSVISFIALWWQYVNVLLPDELNFYRQGAYDAIRWATSGLIVVFPIYLLTVWLIGRDFKQEPAKRDIRIRKWLVYLTLFIAAITIIIDLVQLVFNFYGGELTMRFSLKVLVVLAVAAAVFWYHLWDLRRSDSQSSRPKAIAWVISIIVALSIIGGFFIVGTPAQQRRIRFDEQRVSDLQLIQSQALNYWMQKNRLPQNLDDLRDSISGFTAPVDPESGVAYSYRILGPLSFELCAEFKTENRGSGNDKAVLLRAPSYFEDPYALNWAHGTGRVCFERAIDPELYKKLIPVQ